MRFVLLYGPPAAGKLTVARELTTPIPGGLTLDNSALSAAEAAALIVARLGLEAGK